MSSPQASATPSPVPAPDAQSGGTDTPDDALLCELVQAHAGRLQRFVARHIGSTTDAEDLAQQAFAEAARSYRTFRGESQLSTWLYGIALNLVRNYLSRSPEYRYEFTDESALDQHHAETLAPAELAERRQSIELLQQALDELPANMRDILLLVGLDGLSYEEAAVMLTVPVGTVRSRLSRARAALRDRLSRKGLELDF